MTSKPFTPEAAERLAQKLADWSKPVDPVEAFAGRGFKNFANGPRKHGNFAHFPGTGPTGYTCYTCRFLAADGKEFRCGKFQQLMGRAGEPINAASDACSYYQVKA